MEIYDRMKMRDGLANNPAAYNEFFRVPALSAGLYRQLPNATDPQKPHHEDEIYFVLSGSGKIMVKSEVEEIRPGDFIYVKAGDEHRFLDISETLEVLVVFAPAETE